MSKSSRNRGPAWSCRSASATLVGMPGAPSASIDIVRASTQARTNTSQSGSSWRTGGPTPAVAAARVLCRSFARSTASRSVAAPGMRTKCGFPSTVTFQLAFVRPAAIGSAVTARPAHGGIAAMTCSIVGVTVSMAALLPQRIGRSEARERSPGNLQGSELARLHHRPEPGEIAPERARECPCQEPVERTQPPAHREVPVPVDPRAAIDRCERP